MLLPQSPMEICGGELSIAILVQQKICKDCAEEFKGLFLLLYILSRFFEIVLK